MKLSLLTSRQNAITVFIIFIILFETAAYIYTTPQRTEQLFQLYVLGANKLVGGYFPANNPNLRVRSAVSWYIGVGNFMENVQLVEIIVKLGNLTTTTPNDTTGIPSSAPAIVTFSRVLLDNETWEFPFDWFIMNATRSANAIRVLTMQIGNSTYQVPDWSAASGYNFRLIIELWTWQTSNSCYEFGWSSNGVHRIAWLQLWFNLTSVQVPPPPPPPP